MRKILKYEFKRSIMIFVIAIVIGLIGYFLLLWGSSYIAVESFTLLTGCIGLIIVIVLIFYNFSYNKKKIKSDLYYSLPITRKNLFLGKYLYSIFEITVLYLVLLIFTYLFAGLLSVGITFSSNALYLPNDQLLKIGLIILIQWIACIGLFNIMLLFYTGANNIFDSIISVILISFLPALLLTNITKIVDLNLVNNYLSDGVNLNFLTMSIEWPNYLLLNINDAYYGYNTSFIIAFLFLTSISFLPLFSYNFNLFAEDVELPDNKIWGYKICIPTLITLLTLNISLNFDSFGILLILFCFITFLHYVLYAIFERKFRISKKKFIVFSLFTGVGIVMMIIV